MSQTIPLTVRSHDVHLPQFLVRVGETLALWRRRNRERAELAMWTQRDIRDAGLTPGDVAFEINKPFWRD